jgi:hypothetical protein
MGSCSHVGFYTLLGHEVYKAAGDGADNSDGEGQETGIRKVSLCTFNSDTASCTFEADCLVETP